MKTIQLQNKDNLLTSPLQVDYCDDFASRLRGLMFQPPIIQGRGLLLVQAHDSRLDSSIHMFFVTSDLGVTWINNDMVVVDTVLALAWRPIYIPRRPARYVLETHPAHLSSFRIGDRVEFIED